MFQEDKSSHNSEGGDVVDDFIYDIPDDDTDAFESNVFDLTSKLFQVMQQNK